MTLAESRPIPSHCVVVRAGLDRRLASGLQEALLALNQGPDRQLLERLYNVDGYVAVDHETYLETAKLARRHGFLR